MIRYLLHLPSVIALARDLWRPRRDDLTALMDATAEPLPADLIDRVKADLAQARIDLAVADFAAEIEACADAELAEMTGGAA